MDDNIKDLIDDDDLAQTLVMRNAQLRVLRNQRVEWIKERRELRAELRDAKDKLRQCALSWKDINSERIDLRQALETWKQSAKMWRDSATYGDRWHSDDLGCDYIGDYKLYRLLRRGGE